MGSGTCVLSIVFIMLVAALACTVIALVTDYWCDVSTNTLVGSALFRANNYRFGLWRRCYDNLPTSFLTDPEVDRSGSDCIWTYKDLIPEDFDSLTFDQKRVIHLSRSVIGLSITAGALIIGALLALVCGTIPGDCNKVKRATLYTSSSFIILFGAMAGIASGICFIAARDIEEEASLDYDYQWSFMLHWIGTGLTLLAGFLNLCLLKDASDDASDNMKYYYNM